MSTRPPASATPAATEDTGRRVTGLGYVLAWAGVAALAIASYLLAGLPLGGWALPVALAIAWVQATLVAFVFMHLAEGRGTRRFAFPVSVFFVLLLLALVFADITDRYPPALPGRVAHEVEPRPTAPSTRPPDLAPGPASP